MASAVSTSMMMLSDCALPHLLSPQQEQVTPEWALRPIGITIYKESIGGSYRPKEHPWSTTCSYVPRREQVGISFRGKGDIMYIASVKNPEYWLRVHPRRGEPLSVAVRESLGASNPIRDELMKAGLLPQLTEGEALVVTRRPELSFDNNNFIAVVKGQKVVRGKAGIRFLLSLT